MSLASYMSTVAYSQQLEIPQLLTTVSPCLQSNIQHRYMMEIAPTMTVITRLILVESEKVLYHYKFISLSSYTHFNHQAKVPKMGGL